jgi:hypothetical protein
MGAAHDLERVSAGAPQIVFTMVSSVTGSIGSQKYERIIRIAVAPWPIETR